MPIQDRKQFIQSIAFTGLALLTQKINLLSQTVPYNYLLISNEDVIFYEKTNPEYETLRKGFNKRINNYPKIIALCKTQKGVAEAIQYAIAKKLKVTVKSGGHCMEGFSSLNGGIVINVSLLNTIEFIDSNTIKIGPACTLKKMYETLLPQGMYLSGGSCQSVAISGLSLGGGYGLLSRKYGLTCDSLLEATMVDAKGNIINTKNDAELLWACKGGGNGNFGVITELKFKVQPAPATMQSFKFRHQNVTIDKAKEICRQWFVLSKNLPKDCFSAFIFNGKTTYILLTTIDKNLTNVNGFIQTFKALSTKFTEGNVLPLAQALKAYYAEAKPITFKNASAGLYKNFAEIETIVEDVFKIIASTPGILYQINTLGGNIQSQSFEENASFAHRDCIYFSELQAYWESPSVTNKFLNKFESIQELFAKKGINAQYRNYPDINFKKSDELYYGKNLERLLQVKNKYDKNNLFGGVQSLQV